MQTQITVTVTQGHIDRGLRGKCTRCPVAMAIKDAARGKAQRFRGRVAVFTGITKIEPYAGERSALAGLWELPEAVEEFISAFDIGHGRPRVRPFTFTMRLKHTFTASRPWAHRRDWLSP